MSTIVCTPKVLTPEQEAAALRRAVEINPGNAASMRSVVRTPPGRIGGPKRLALLIGNRWPASGVDLSVQFLDKPAAALRRKILEHMNAWSASANVRFRETSENGMVRVARYDHPVDVAGYWSYVGTQILGIAPDQPTLNLQGFSSSTPESEFRRVVRHEAGHTLGFEHEHMRSELVKLIDRKKAFAFFDRTQGWTRADTLAQVLTPLKNRSIMGTTESDPNSIMCYQIPGDITKTGKPIAGGTDINGKDAAFAAKVYPRPDDRTAQPSGGSGEATKRPTRPGRDQPPAGEPSAPQHLGPRPRKGVDPSEVLQIVILDDPVAGSDDVPAKAPPKAEGKPRASAANAPRFARVFASYAGAQVTSAFRLNSKPGEPRTAFGEIIAMHERIKGYADRRSGFEPPSEAEMIAFGTRLFEVLFHGDVKRLYDEARARNARTKLDLVLTSMIPWLAEKPWEFAYDPSRRSFLATEDVHLVRNVKTTVPADPVGPEDGPLRILVAAAQPAGFARLSVDEEVELIRRGFEPLISAGLIEVEVQARATPSMLQGLLSSEEFSVLHFIGHGIFDGAIQRGALSLEDDTGRELPLGERSAREIFGKRGLKLVFLNSCQSGTGSRNDSNVGLAQALVSHGLPALVANQYSVLDSSATYFAQHFYWALAQGMSLGRAACEARIAVNSSIRGEAIDWAVPVVYARDPNMVLRLPPAQSSPVPATAARADKRRAIEGHAIRVAIWDVDGLFPMLDSTLDRLNSHQQVFGFEVAALSAPFDAWDLATKAPDGGPYLHAERLASRLGKMAAQLGVDVLACVTAHWLRDGNHTNLYGWWDDRNTPVVIFSCAGFDQLPPSGVATDRVIANVLTDLLAGFLTGMDSHEHGAKDCPLAFNPERDFRHLVGRQKFDRGCRAKLKKAVPYELPALEALLKAFH